MPGAGMVVEVSSALPLNYRSVEVTHFDEDETHQNYFFFNEQKLHFPIDKLKDSKKKINLHRTFSFRPELLKAWFAPTSSNHHRKVQVSILLSQW